MRIGYVVWNDAGDTSCAHCDGSLGEVGGSWKDACLIRRENAAERLRDGETFTASFRVREHPDLELVEIICPHCLRLLSVEIYVVGEPLRRTYRTLDQARAESYDPVAEHREAPGEWISFVQGRQD